MSEGKQCNKWVKINSEVKHYLQTVTPLGWEPATESRPAQLSGDKDLRRRYLSAATKPDGTVGKDTLMPLCVDISKLICFCSCNNSLFSLQV